MYSISLCFTKLFSHVRAFCLLLLPFVKAAASLVRLCLLCKRNCARLLCYLHIFMLVYSRVLLPSLTTNPHSCVCVFISVVCMYIRYSSIQWLLVGSAAALLGLLRIVLLFLLYFFFFLTILYTYLYTMLFIISIQIVYDISFA